MPVGLPKGHDRYHSLIRRVTALRASVAFQVECKPAFNYARDQHQVRIGRQGACFDSPGFNLGLMTEVPVRNEGGAARAEFILEEGRNATFVLQGLTGNAGCRSPLADSEASALLQNTVEYWQRWLSKCTYRGRWNEMVSRSALVLELLTYEPTGAVVAAPTCSLPESLGESRNWDYRCSWI
jgi:GH15 family glucan-1,4-alpha-glucosidase